MKQKYVYFIDVSCNGWMSVGMREVNEKDKNGFYLCYYSLNLGPDADEGFSGSTVEASFLFKDENIKWWRTPEAAQAALNKELHELYLKSELPLKHYNSDYEDNWDSLPTEGDLFPDKDWC